MAMMIIIPLPHYENYFEFFWKSEKKNVSESLDPPPPPPPPPAETFFRAGAKILDSRRSSETFCPPPQANTLAPALTQGYGYM